MNQPRGHGEHSARKPAAPDGFKSSAPAAGSTMRGCKKRTSPPTWRVSLSIGIDYCDDIIDDIGQAFVAVK